MDILNLQSQLERQEGYRKLVYRCPAGYCTIGIGRNIETTGLSHAEALYLLNNDINEIYQEMINYDWFKNLNDMRQNVIINMCFNLGIKGFFKFRNFIKAIESNDDKKVVSEMLDSLWARQVTNRAHELAQQWLDNP